MDTLESFPPLATAGARALVLGSMPGEVSLRERRYYAHPRNAFWWIMGELFGASPELDYGERARVLGEHRVAVWDVLRFCRRPASSLDAKILRATEVPNDFAEFLREHADVRAVFFNGAKAQEAWLRHVVPMLNAELPGRELTLQRLPSTSPAFAGLSRGKKLEVWRAVERAVR